jgi:hypothetical protein
MQRVGPINSQKQSHTTGSTAPVKRGMWAFPFPAMDRFFVSHRYEYYLPKHCKMVNIRKMQNENEKNDKPTNYGLDDIWDEREKALARINKSGVMKTKNFWWKGPIYSRIAPKGDKSEASWYLWTDLKEWARVANASMVAGTWEKHSEPGAPMRFQTFGVDHLELFLPMKASVKKIVAKKKIVEAVEPLPIEKIKEIINTNCSEILEIYRKTKRVLYRGIQCADSYFVTDSPVNRRPKDLPKEIQQAIDEKLVELGFESLRSNSIFCYGDAVYTQSYGSPYVIFPYNGFYFNYNKYFDIAGDMQFDIADKIKNYSLEEFQKYFDYQNTNLEYAMINQKEICIHGRYLAVKVTSNNLDELSKIVGFNLNPSYPVPKSWHKIARNAK